MLLFYFCSLRINLILFLNKSNYLTALFSNRCGFAHVDELFYFFQGAQCFAKLQFAVVIRVQLRKYTAYGRIARFAQTQLFDHFQEVFHRNFFFNCIQKKAYNYLTRFQRYIYFRNEYQILLLPSPFLSSDWNMAIGFILSSKSTPVPPLVPAESPFDPLELFLPPNKLLPMLNSLSILVSASFFFSFFINNLLEIRVLVSDNKKKR